MDIQLDAPPSTRDWMHAGPSTTSKPPGVSAFSKRRISAAHGPASAPPPTEPMPQLPEIQDPFYQPGPYVSTSTFTTRRTHVQPSSTASSSTDNLSDPPPRSILHQPHKQTSYLQRDPPQDKPFLSVQPQRPPETRPSSRRALTRALELARAAVELDSTNTDPHGAVVAYGRSVALLNQVMERVRSGEDSTESRRRPGRRRSVVAQEEEVRRLKSIHDTYADRMNILSLIYSIPPIPHSPTSVFMSTSTQSTQPSSPTSDSPTSTSSEADAANMDQQYPESDLPEENEEEEEEGNEAIGMFFMGSSPGSTPGSFSTARYATSYHPYAAATAYSPPPKHMITPPTPSLGRMPTLPPARRSRASSALPPPAPPPVNSPPPAPETFLPESPPPVEAPSNLQAKQRAEALLQPQTRTGDAIGHRRSGSGGRVAILKEEAERFLPKVRSSLDETPLPPVPSPSSSSSSPTSPRTAQQGPTQPAGPRTRAGSIQSTKSDGSANLINPSPLLGTISMRRSKPPNSAGSSEGPRLTASVLPASTATSLGMRSRSSSQPGRRPSIIDRATRGQSQAPPPVPASASVLNGHRKSSFQSKLNPNPPPPQLYLQTDFSQYVTIPAGSLVPPPPMQSGNLPTTPTSPMPPIPPNDALRKPYHMMHLLRTTMTSKTGGYVTKRLHVPHEVWSQGGAKLANVAEKVRVVEVLWSALEDVQRTSVEYFGTGDVISGFAPGGVLSRKQGEAWLAKLDEFMQLCDNLVASFGKKLGVGEGFVAKKDTGVSAWGSKFARRLDKLTNGKTLDSPAAYVTGLAKLFSHAQLLDEHTKALMSQPPAPVYAALPLDIRAASEIKLKRCSQFFASVVLTFVICDLSELLGKYAKECAKWLSQ